jgi:hypothetical protein
MDGAPEALKLFVKIAERDGGETTAVRSPVATV